MTGVLNELCNLIDAESPGSVPTILLLDSDGVHLRLAAGPKVPEKWTKVFDGLKMPSHASFGTAAPSRGRQVPVADVRCDPSFAGRWDLAISERIEAVWAAPILSRTGMILGTLILFYPAPHTPVDGDLQLIEQATHLAAIALDGHINEEERQRCAGLLYRSQDEERRRIARELHDSTGQKLALLSINLSILKDGIPAQLREEKLAQCASLTSSISDELRTLSYLLHPPMLDDCGLETALQWYVSGINQRPGLKVELEITYELPRLTQEAELALFRVVQASLTNVHLHSKASKAFVRVEQTPAEVIVTIIDNGQGIPDGVVDRASRTSKVGVGIAGMRERMAQLSGFLEIKTSSRGTKVIANVPKRHLRTAV
ncbi:MAG: GAF domain-containing sensor histidine kinase [Candidatus Acidiferrales bacterium]